MSDTMPVIPEPYSLGLDIGSVNVKLILADAKGAVVRRDVEKITASARPAVAALLDRLSIQVPLDRIGSAGVSGMGAELIPAEWHWAVYSSSLALAAGVLQGDPDARTIIQVGGQTSLAVRLADGLRRPWQVATNPLCAAGTGRFLEQQAHRLKIGLEDFGPLALGCQGKPPRIAARCSVFAKSDLIHLQQKGVPVNAMLYALCESIARMVAALTRGPVEEPVYVAGGVAGNAAFVRALDEVLSSRNGHPVHARVPDDYLHLEAYGAALLARGRTSQVAVLPPGEARRTYVQMPALSKPVAELNPVHAQHAHPFPRREEGDGAPLRRGEGSGVGSGSARVVGYLGVDVGSTSTKAAIVDGQGRVLAKHYLMTAGRPIDAVKELFTALLERGAGEIDIRGVGVTGSGRYLVGSFIGADLVKNEITAQTRAAAEIDPEADIIEIGGQDSKLVLKRNGVVVDYQMNKACAAGTGSFIDELAELLGVQVKTGEFARLALTAPYTIDLGTRCAAFMAQAVASAQQEGVPIEIITASLAVAIARNYLSKVVGNRKLGQHVMLTGAVFYNDAVAAAFHDQLPGKTLRVPEHKEVSGAIGAALLAREAMAASAAIAPAVSHFKGFAVVVASQPKLTNFTCQHCANNCAITRMQNPGEAPTYYGSRCDRYDSDRGNLTAHVTYSDTVILSDTTSPGKRGVEGREGAQRADTWFDERERLLFRDYREGAASVPAASVPAGSGPLVGVPRGLLMYDYAPMVLSFLNALGARAVLSPRTNKEIMEQAVELAYTDSCFPVKLLHGHVAALDAAGVRPDYILYPSMLRLGEKDGDANQRYACPLVQASPYIVRAALELEGRLLSPAIDLSRGRDAVIRSLAETAVTMGFSRRQGTAAARAALDGQARFAADLDVLAARRLADLRASGRLGVVLFARAYMSQDAGANLGIAEKLAQLGVTPIPLDFLPLGSVDPKRYSDRPYWQYESKQIAAAALTEADPQLYGLILTNFGCGPNSFILRMVEDIMGAKPLGQLEIDEHAAEAGIVTRLEAFVDTIEGHARYTGALRPAAQASAAIPATDGRQHDGARVAQVYRGANATISTGKTLLLPRMAAHADVLAAAFNACGAHAVVLPEPDERNLIYANEVTSGVECLPYRVTLGDFIRAHHEMNGQMQHAEAFMAGSYGPCRLGKYGVEQMRILREMGIDLTIRTSVSNHAYRDLNLGPGFERLAWQGIVAMDALDKLLWRTRPYEREAGAGDALHAEYTARLAEQVGKKAPLGDTLRRAAAAFADARDPSLPRRPRVGINGEIYLRANRFSNSDLARVCEAAGLEVVISPMGEWFKYTAFRNVEDATHDRRYPKAAIAYIKQLVQESDERSATAQAAFAEREPTTAELLHRSGRWLSPSCGSEAVLSLGSAVEWLESPDFAGVISVMPHGCMPGGIVAAMSEKLSAHYSKPWINLTYDGFLESNNLARINNFAEVIRFARENA
jgi:predicted CoA-substrate-specific enzyme activase